MYIGFGYYFQKYINNLFWDLIPKIYFQNVHKNEQSCPHVSKLCMQHKNKDPIPQPLYSMYSMHCMLSVSFSGFRDTSMFQQCILADTLSLSVSPTFPTTHRSVSHQNLFLRILKSTAVCSSNPWSYWPAHSLWTGQHSPTYYHPQAHHLYMFYWCGTPAAPSHCPCETEVCAETKTPLFISQFVYQS